ncbi:MAG: DUF1501 domain-containing protein [Gemmatimonadaceae bacterium]
MLLSSQGAVAFEASDARVLVIVFLRGGADGLALVPPAGEDAYHRARPRLRVDPRQAQRLDDRFALHPRLAPLHPLFTRGDLAVVHAAGSEDSTRSHFEAQDLMEHGGVMGGGWLGRFLRFRPVAGSRALAAIAFGTQLPECLRGAPAATVLRSLDDFSLGDDAGRIAQSLDVWYRRERGPLADAARDTLRALHRLQTLRGAPYRPRHGANYGADDFAQALQQVAQLIKAQVGLEAVSIDLGGWDSHFTQGTLIDPLMSRLASGLAAFATDLGSLLNQTSVVVMTEFGRRVGENASLGTDHGRGSTMFVIGGGVAGGRVHGDWPGLDAAVLDGPGDLPVRNDYRDVLARVLERHGGGGTLHRVFPGHAVRRLEL